MTAAPGLPVNQAFPAPTEEWSTDTTANKEWTGTAQGTGTTTTNAGDWGGSGNQDWS